MSSGKQEDHKTPVWKRLARGTEIRGSVNALTEEAALKIGYVFAQWLADSIGTTSDKLTIAVGSDSRRGNGRRVAAAVIRGLTSADCDVVDCGVTATPVLFMSTHTDSMQSHAAIMVSASVEKNGIRFLLRDGHITESDIQELLRRAETVSVPDRLVTRRDMQAEYVQHLAAVARDRLEDDALRPLLGLRVVVDGAGGAGGFFAGFLEELGVDTEGSMNLDPDPERSSYSADPSDPTMLARLSAAVLENEADLGVVFSPDCSRAAFVAEDGRPILRNRLIALVAAIVLEDEPGATFVTDSVTSSGLARYITEWGGIHYRYKRGYLNVVDEAIRLNEENINCPVAMETSGHCAFRENRFHDDGIYLATWLICEALDRKREGQTLSTLIDELREPVERAEIRLPVRSDELRPAALELIETIMAHTLDNARWTNAPDNREGVRIIFNLEDGIANAWFQLRVSVHDPVLVLDAESEVEGGLKDILGELWSLLRDSELEDIDLSPIGAWLENNTQAH